MVRFPGLIDIVAVGKIKEKHWRTAQDEYLKRLNRYFLARLSEVKDALGQGLPDATALQREGQELLRASAGAHYRIALTPEGKTFTSPGLAEFLMKHLETHGRLAFLIGGPLGFAPDLTENCDCCLSLSTLTLPHELARVVLLEQLFRAAAILNGEKYHK